jgi:dUTP pyrophosphatase
MTEESPISNATRNKKTTPAAAANAGQPRTITTSVEERAAIDTQVATEDVLYHVTVDNRGEKSKVSPDCQYISMDDKDSLTSTSRRLATKRVRATSSSKQDRPPGKEDLLPVVHQLVSPETTFSPIEVNLPNQPRPRCDLFAHETGGEREEESTSEALGRCSYEDRGCIWKGKTDKVGSHAARCLFRRAHCPAGITGACRWKGPLNELYSHIIVSQCTMFMRPCKLRGENNFSMSLVREFAPRLTHFNLEPSTGTGFIWKPILLLEEIPSPNFVFVIIQQEETRHWTFKFRSLLKGTALAKIKIAFEIAKNVQGTAQPRYQYVGDVSPTEHTDQAVDRCGTLLVLSDQQMQKMRNPHGGICICATIFQPNNGGRLSPPREPSQLAIQLSREEGPIRGQLGFKWAKLSDQACRLTPTGGQGGGVELKCSREISLPSQSSAIVETDIQIIMPPGTLGKIIDRPGSVYDSFLNVCPRNIEHGDDQAQAVVICNMKPMTVLIRRGDVIAQIVCEKILVVQFQEVEPTAATLRMAGYTSRRRETWKRETEQECLAVKRQKLTGAAKEQKKSRSRARKLQVAQTKYAEKGYTLTRTRRPNEENIEPHEVLEIGDLPEINQLELVNLLQDTENVTLDPREGVFIRDDLEEPNVWKEEIESPDLALQEAIGEVAWNEFFSHQAHDNERGHITVWAASSQGPATASKDRGCK